MPMTRLPSPLQATAHLQHKALRSLATVIVSTMVAATVGCSVDTLSSAPDDSSRTIDQEVIYDGNSLSEVGNLPYWHRWFAESRSTAALVKSADLSCDADECEVAWTPHQEGQVGSRMLPLCSDEPFVGQPVASSCTAFLIGNDLMATAGHCARSANFCASVAVLFDYTVNVNTGQANTTFDRDREVYYCSELVALGYEGSEIEHNDFAVFRLDRPTQGRISLNLRESGTIPQYTPLDTLGTPLGLPLKVEEGGYVRHTSANLPRFETTIDASPGSSGGPVFNYLTREVEGILVDGTSKMYQLGHESNGAECARSYQCDGWTGCPVTDHRWVLVSRIERVVEVLEERSCFDGQLNGQESDVDCGGPNCKPCDPGGQCDQNSDCGGGYLPPACHVGYCNSGTCAVDTSSCECHVASDCDDGDPCTQDHCGRNVCYNYTGACN